MSDAYSDILNTRRDYDVIISDSCTCTSDPHPDHPYDKNWDVRDRSGYEFNEELLGRGADGEYYPLWGAGLQAM